MHDSLSCERNALSLCARACGSPHPCVPSLLALEKWCFENMHSCDAKGIFFSEVHVLRVAQSNLPRDVYRHVIRAGGNVDVRAGAARVVVLSPQNGYFCFSMGISCPLLFFTIYSNLSFHMHFYQCFFMLPLAACSITPRGLDVWVVTVAILCAHHVLFIKILVRR